MIREKLFALRDPEYRDFTIRLNPTLDPDTIIGVRIPALRELARELREHPDLRDFLDTLPHRFHEENLLHVFYLNALQDVDVLLAELDRFAPYITGWLVCDTIHPKILNRHPERTREHIEKWLVSDLEFTIRLAVNFLRIFFLDKHFTPDVLELAAAVPTERYYLKMMVAWFFCDAIIKQPEEALPYITERRLARPTHFATIQKCVESRRVSPDLKARLKTFRQ